MAAFSGALLRAVGAGEQDAPAATPKKARVERGAYLVTTMGCNDCHTPWKMGAQRSGARHDARAHRSSRGA